MTLRQIYELLKTEGEEFLDAELFVNVRCRGKVVSTTAPRDLWGFPRMASVKQTGEKARLSMDVHLPDNYVLSQRKR